MRELGNNDIGKVSGGVATGWVPANWQLLNSHYNFQGVIGVPAILLPGVIPGPMLPPGPLPSNQPAYVTSGLPGGPADWEC